MEYRGRGQGSRSRRDRRSRNGTNGKEPKAGDSLSKKSVKNQIRDIRRMLAKADAVAEAAKKSNNRNGTETQYLMPATVRQEKERML
eukprot:UC4_evm1s1484